MVTREVLSLPARQRREGVVVVAIAIATWPMLM